jgi:DNA-binding response OmpR family regulator
MPNKRKILLVDDESDILDSLKIGLEDNGFTVETYTDSVLALSNFKVDVYDIVLLDVKMPSLFVFPLSFL